jgi:hypothetical protein
MIKTLSWLMMMMLLMLNAFQETDPSYSQSSWDAKEEIERDYTMTLCVHRVSKSSKRSQMCFLPSHHHHLLLLFCSSFSQTSLFFLWYFISREPHSSSESSLYLHSSSSSFCLLSIFLSLTCLSSIHSMYSFHSLLLSYHHFMAIIHSRKRGVDEDIFFDATSDLRHQKRREWKTWMKRKTFSLKTVAWFRHLSVTANWGSIKSDLTICIKSITSNHLLLLS